VSGLTEVSFEGFVHAQDGSLVDGRGRSILMRGVGLGNWLLPEGYMWRFPREAPQSGREIEALVEDLVGVDAAAAFWRGFRERFIGEADIRRIAAEGFDHVRLPLNARLLIDEHGDLRPDGIAPIDRLIGWCRLHRLWVVLDLHGAPGGQTGTNIDDSPRGLPDLFLVDGAYRELTITLWTRLAERYRNETVIAGYDLLNEPLPHEYGPRFEDELVELYRDLTTAIRSVDPDHLITYEGTRWSTDWNLFSEVWDPNSMLQFHKYWSAPDRPSIAEYLERAEALSLPIYMGEGGENDPRWLQTAFALYEDLGISWNFWPWKKLETWTSPVSVTPPKRWDELVRYASGQGTRPSATEARELLDDLLDRMPLDACEYRTEVINALFHRVPVLLAPEAFGFLGAGASYRTVQAQPLDGFRNDDQVTIIRTDGGQGDIPFDHSDTPGRDASGLEVVLGSGDWLDYSVAVAVPSRVSLEIALEPDDLVHGEPLILLFDGVVVDSVFKDGHVRGTTDEEISAGRHLVRIEGRVANTVISSVSVSPSGGCDPVL
jgi:hypothetical protein